MRQITTEQWTQAILSQHRHLRELVAGLEGFVERPRPALGEEGAHDWAAELSERLVKLHDALFRHFRFEEEGDHVEEIVARHPRADRSLAEVVGEHPQILGDVRELMAETLAYSAGAPLEDDRLRKRLRSLLERMEHHERAETELIMSLEYRDLGGKE